MLKKLRLALRARALMNRYKEVSRMNPNWWKGKTMIGALAAALGTKLAKYGQAISSGQPINAVELLSDVIEVAGIVLTAAGVRHAIAKNGTGQ